jgi:ParB-like chromosome segregation protein Spo0J
MTKKTKNQPSGIDAKTSFEFEPLDISISKLLLDPNNYRFLDGKKFKKKAANRSHEETVQRATLDSLEASYQLDELKHSILSNGYVPIERVIVVPYAAKAGYFLVVEGNRRVASLKSLLKEEQDGVRVLSTQQRSSFAAVPCAVLKSSGLSLKRVERIIMGIRHIAGPKEWGAYQQALLVRELKDDDGLEFRVIGETLGIPSAEAARRYRAITALKQMENDELFSKKADPDYYRLFHELVALPGVRARFGWSAEKNEFTDMERAHEFFELICGDSKHDPKLKTFNDIRKLKSIIGHPKGEDSLFNPEESFSEAIRAGEQGRKKEEASDLLDEAKQSLMSIGLFQVQKLTTKDLNVVDELLAFLEQLKKAAPTQPNKPLEKSP